MTCVCVCVCVCVCASLREVRTRDVHAQSQTSCAAASQSCACMSACVESVRSALGPAVGFSLIYSRVVSVRSFVSAPHGPFRSDSGAERCCCRCSVGGHGRSAVPAVQAFMRRQHHPEAAWD